MIATTKRDGPSDGPVVIVTPAWRDPGAYSDLVAALPDATTVISVEVHEPPGCAESRFHRLDEVADESCRLVAPQLAGRSTVVLGHSTDGVVAHELGRRLAERSLTVSFVALLDTFYPGRRWLSWSVRWDKYRSFARDRAADEILHELRRAVGFRRRQIRRKIAASRTDTPSPDESSTGPERIRGSRIPADVRVREPVPSGVPLVLYLAINTLRSGCELPWRALEPHAETVSVQGRHSGENEMLSIPWVTEITEDIARRLAHDPDPRPDRADA